MALAGQALRSGNVDSVGGAVLCFSVLASHSLTSGDKVERTNNRFGIRTCSCV